MDTGELNRSTELNDLADGNVTAESNEMPEKDIEMESKMESKNKLKKSNKKNRTFLGNAFVKVIFVILFVLSMTGAACAGYFTFSMEEYGAYEYNKSEFTRKMMADYIWEEYYSIRARDLDLSNMGVLRNYVSDCVKLRLVNMDTNEILWSDYDGFETPYTYSIQTSYVSSEEYGEGILKRDFSDYYEGKAATLNSYRWEFFIDPEIASESSEYLLPNYYNMQYCRIMNNAPYLYEIRYYIPVIFAACLILALILFIILMFSAGYHNGREGISASIWNFVPLDLYMVIWAAVEFCLVGVAYDVIYTDEFTSNISFTATVIMVWGVLENFWCIALAMECMTRLKLGKFWRNTIIYKAVNFIARIIGRIVLAAAGRLPQIINNLIAYFAVVMVEFIIMLLMRQRSSLGLPQFGLALWIIEKIILLIFVIYFSLCSAKIRAAGEALAKGDLSYSLDTSDMILSQKKHGENLNSIAQGINAAVEERMKSERLKTELITNVSHDLKTPLTSIINYSNLIVNETQIAASIEKGDEKNSKIDDTDSNNDKDALINSNDRIHEYAEVLNRQSMRLKKLLEDLLEASKATTGNVDLNMQPCDVGVMLTQTIGEYENKFEEKKLNLLVKQTETPVRIMADSRHMWRIFDNLMNNIYKYALENTRVYLTVEKKGETVNIIFRNISEYELDVSAEELTERFTRGDKSRHMEGNGLGLSIAASLVNLQKGSMEISTDGDLFKVTLTFPII